MNIMQQARTPSSLASPLGAAQPTTAPAGAPTSSAARRLRERYGPWAVVTGASDGIGRAFAARLAAAGVHLVLAARRDEVLGQLAAELTRQHGIDTRVVACDLSTRSGVAALAERSDDVEVGLLVAAAGFGTSGDFLAGALQSELDMVDVNCGAVVALAHHLGARLAGRGRGGIVLLSSIVAFQGVPRATTYAATKAFVQSFAEGLARELAPRGVDVLACAPGPVASGFARRADMELGATTTADEVARGALAALRRGGTVRPGRLSKLLGWSLAMLPRAVRVRLMAVIMGGMTRHHRPAAAAPAVPPDPSAAPSTSARQP
jgi:uncharacterized protein